MACFEVTNSSAQTDLEIKTPGLKLVKIGESGLKKAQSSTLSRVQGESEPNLGTLNSRGRNFEKLL